MDSWSEIERWIWRETAKLMLAIAVATIAGLIAIVLFLPRT